MKFGVVRNVAGNIDALKDADQQLDELGVDVKVCLGQIVGMYPWVDECIDYLVQQGYQSMRQLVDDEFVGGCKFVGWSKICLASAVRFAHSRASKGATKFLASLPQTLEIGGVAFEGLAKIRNRYGDFVYSDEEVKAAFTTWSSEITVHAANYEPWLWHEIYNNCKLPSGPSHWPEGRVLISTGGVGCIGNGAKVQPDALVITPEGNLVQVVDMVRSGSNYGKASRIELSSGIAGFYQQAGIRHMAESVSTLFSL